VIFDLDQTLLNTENLLFKAIYAALKKLTGKELTEDLAMQALGLPDKGPHSWPAKILEVTGCKDGKITPDMLFDSTDEMFSAVCEEADPMPGAKELVGELHGCGIPLAIATSSMRHHVLLKRKNHESTIFYAFPHIVCVEDVATPKPSPLPYVLAAERLGLSPSQCIAVEDSLCGMESALRAGCFVVSLPDHRVAAQASELIQRLGGKGVVLESMLDLVGLEWKKYMI